MNHKSTALIVTTYRPDVNFSKRFYHLHCDVDFIIVVDNTPGGHSFEEPHKIIILQDGVNKGLGGALNLGVEKALQLGCHAVILFDQDSSPDSKLINGLFSIIANHCASNICIGPSLVDDLSGESIYIRSSDADVEYCTSVTCLPTSGMCFSVEKLELSDSFSTEFFLDFVDFEWCWRLYNKGWVFFRVNGLSMEHRLGLGQKSFLGLKFHVPSPFRHYYQFRDTIRLLRTKIPLYSKLRLGLILLPKFILYPFILNQGYERFSWMLLGIRDAFLSRKGVGAAAFKLL